MSQPLSDRTKSHLFSVVKRLFQENKGILALDQSERHFNVKFNAYCLENNPHNRARYREIFITANPKFTKAISGVVFSREGFYQRTKDGRLFTDILRSYKIAVGVRMDGPKSIDDDFEKRNVIIDLDTLPKRLNALKISGCDFTKAQMRLNMSQFTPELARKHAELLSLFAAFCQKVAIVPVIVIVGVYKGDHTLERCKQVLSSSLCILKATLFQHNVYIKGTVIALQWVTKGVDCPTEYTITQMAEATHDILITNIVPAMYGIMFLSSTGEEKLTTEVLNEIVKLNLTNKWRISFIFSRAVQASALDIWHGRDDRLAYAQNEFLKRIRANYLALQGNYHDFLMLKNPYTAPEPGHHYDDLFDDD
ncbi:fructose-bisphosphate aldolase C-A-like [Teleopsis dalmanni]|uniref:fructose-bisphosphate aldolase C-A-like n=1 Tax=Teleopsis dalmanni TaxID=139649 RepID=UPI0018CE4821|nr:fructose-bisphosphate aldolase C-A-like [Teleopsis dalmanni]